MQQKVLSPSHWKSYQLLDCGDHEKLERFGRFVLRRPEPQAVWPKSLSESDWAAKADIHFKPKGSSGGDWIKKDVSTPDRWKIRYSFEDMSIGFRLGLTRFKHVGLFPEQSENWDYIYTSLKKLTKPKVLNLFAYTGGASLAARAAGAEVYHLDSIKQVVSWARENMILSSLDDIRWVVEDALKFVKREVKRGNKYNGVFLDPPAYGHGPKGEKWKLEEMVNELIKNVNQIIIPDHSILVINAYSQGLPSLALKNLVQQHFPPSFVAQSEYGELVLTDTFDKQLSTGVFFRSLVC